MVKVYGKKGPPETRRTLPTDAHDSSHRRAYTWVNAQGRKKWRKRKEEFFFPVPGSGFEPGTLTLEGKAPVCIATITLHKNPWFQLLYKHHEGYILNSIAQYPMHMKERERSVIELNLKVQKTTNIAEYEQL